MHKSLAIVGLIAAAGWAQAADPQDLWEDVDTILNTVADHADPGTWGFKGTFPGFRQRVETEAARAGAAFLSFFQNYPPDGWTDIANNLAGITDPAAVAEMREQVMALGFSAQEAEALLAAFAAGGLDAAEAAVGDLFKGAGKPTDPPKAMRALGFAPFWLAVKSANHLMLADVLSLASQRALPPPNPLDVTLGYERWDVDDGDGGETYTAIPALACQGPNRRWTLALPYARVNVDNQADDLSMLGLDGRLTWTVNPRVKVGGRLGVANYHGAGVADDDVLVWDLGTYAGYQLPVGDAWGLSFGGLVNYLNIEAAGDTWLGGLAADLGATFGDRVGLDLYAIFYANLDAKDQADGEFVELGVQGAVRLSQTTDGRLGLKTTLGYDHYAAVEAYGAIHVRF